MKKILAILTILMCFASVSLFSQECRGIETRRVIYENGKEYSYTAGYYSTGTPYYGHSTKYYGWEFKNLNSCAVSVDISMYRQAHMEGGTYDRINVPAQVVATKTVVLQSGETYIFKNESSSTEAITQYGYENTNVDGYYVEYKAFKLQ